MSYLGNIRESATLTSSDLFDAISKITGRSLNIPSVSEKTSNSPENVELETSSSPKAGEHVAVY